MKAAFVLAGLALFSAVIWLGTGTLHTSDLLIQNAIARPLEGGEVRAFLTIENSGAPDRLVSVSSSAANVSLYSPAAKDGLPVPTGLSSLALDAAHIRITDPTSPLADGSLVPMSLTFEKAGRVNIKARLSDPAEQGHAEEVGLFGLGDICRVGDGEPAPKISLTTTPDGDGWRVSINAEEFTFSKDLMGLYHVPGMGHGHIYVGGMKLGRLFGAEHRIGRLPKGEHEVRVTLNTNDHRAYVIGDDPVTATAVIVVD